MIINNTAQVKKGWDAVTDNWSLRQTFGGTSRKSAQGIPAEAHQREFPVETIRQDFPILSKKVNGKMLIWLDNAATTQKPLCVIDRLKHFYMNENSNVHRGAHTLASAATEAYEEARETVRRFLCAASSNEIIFVRGTTEAVNLAAWTYGKAHIKAGDEILVSHLEHHSNIVPWQQLCKEKGAVLRVIPVDNSGQADLMRYQKLLGKQTKLVSLVHVSNALGTIVPVQDMIHQAHQAGARVFIDGAQAVAHMPVDVTKLDCDFYAFSGHKICGPTGIGALYVKEDILRTLPPYQAGGNMITDVTFEKTGYQEPPARFEAGTGNIADAVGLAAALEYVSDLGMDRIFYYEHYLTQYAEEAMQSVPGLSLIGTAEQKTAILSFILKGRGNNEIGKMLNEEGIAVRTGHHCAQPILRRFGLESTVRPSLAFYNTVDEIDEMVRVLNRIQKDQVKFYLHNPFFMVY